MRTSTLFVSAFAAVASAQSSAPAVVSSSIDAFPQTSFLKQTNSLGVVTGQPGQPAVNTNIPGQPAVVTSQPPVVTAQPAPADIPAVGPGLQTLVLPGTGSLFNTTRTIVVSANNSTTVQIQTSTPASGSASGASGSGARTTGQSGSATGTRAPQNSQGAAANVKIAAGSVLGFGAFVAAFL